MHRMFQINTAQGTYNKNQIMKSFNKDTPKTLNFPLRVNEVKKVVEENQVKL